jgi:predicted DNA-binding transcriptional regulator AlpA
MPRLNLHHIADPAPNGAPAVADPSLAAPALSLLLSARQAAKLCGVSEATWWRLHAAAKCPAPVKIGSSTRWRVEELRVWTEAGCPDRQSWTALRAAGNGGGRR